MEQSVLAIEAALDSAREEGRREGIEAAAKALHLLWASASNPLRNERQEAIEAVEALLSEAEGEERFRNLTDPTKQRASMQALLDEPMNAAHVAREREEWRQIEESQKALRDHFKPTPQPSDVCGRCGHMRLTHDDYERGRGHDFKEPQSGARGKR